MSHTLRPIPLFVTLLAMLAGFFTVTTYALAAPAPQDARLSGYEYPYEVKVHAVSSQQQELEMAYMDVPAKAGVKAANPRTVLLLHGKNFSGAYWASTIEALTAQGHRVIVPDQIGFGKSSKPEAYQFTFQALATHTKGLLDALGVEKVCVVGHSMGGMLATRFTLMFPDAVEKLVLVNPIGLEDWKTMVPYTPVDKVYAQELKQTAEGVKEYFSKSYFAGEWKPEYDPLLEIQAGWIAGAEYQKVAWNAALTANMVFTQPVLYEFPLVKAPTLLIIGQRDRTAIGKAAAPPEVAEELGNYPKLGKAAAKAIPGAKLVELEGIGHIPQVEAFEEYITALGEFLVE